MKLHSYHVVAACVALSLLLGCESPEDIQRQNEEQLYYMRLAREKEQKLESDITDSIRDFKVVYVVTTNQPIKLSYYLSDGTHVQGEPSTHTRWYYAFNPVVGQKIQIAVTNDNYTTSYAPSNITVELYVNGAIHQRERTIAVEHFFNVYTNWFLWK